MDCIRVGLIDSGLNESAIRSNVYFRNCITDENEMIDKNGHGTMCANIIEKYSKQKIEFYVYKIFDEELVSSKGRLIKALQYAYQDKLDILNMSLSVHLDESKEIQELIFKIRK